MYYSGIINCSVVDGKGFRTSLFISGCKHHCEGCQNKETWDFKNGKPYTKEVENLLFNKIKDSKIQGLTLTGGDPLFNKEDIFNLLSRFRKCFGQSKDVWLYTGYKFEDLLIDNNPLTQHILTHVDVLVDGRYMKDLRDTSLAFRGSSNQRIIDVKATLDKNKVITLNL